MNYYKLAYDYPKSDQWIFCNDISDDSLYDVHTFARGIRVNNIQELIYSYNPSEGSIMTDYICNEHGWIIISERCKIAIEEEFGLCIQFIPIKIKNIIDESENNCYIVNVVDVVEAAIDYEKSDYYILKNGGNELYAFTRYVLKASSVENHNIFRLKDAIVPVFCSERFKRIIEKNKLVGFSFRKIELSI